jgi:hypothetical protein
MFYTYILGVKETMVGPISIYLRNSWWDYSLHDFSINILKDAILAL